MRRLLLAPFLFLSLWMFACAPSPWTPIKGTYEAPSRHYSFTAPDGWVKLNVNGNLFITKDGPFLHYVLFQEKPLEHPFQHTSKRFSPDMLPQEAAEIVLDEMRSDLALTDFKVLENGPATLDGHEGFKILFTYKDKKNLPVKCLYYGAIAGDRYYSVRYSAAESDYFEKDLETFQNVMSSFKIT